MMADATSLLLPPPSACLHRVISASPFPGAQFQALLQGVRVQGRGLGANTLRSQGPKLAPGGQASKPGNGEATVGASVGYWGTPISRHSDKALFVPRTSLP